MHRGNKVYSQVVVLSLLIGVVLFTISFNASIAMAKPKIGGHAKVPLALDPKLLCPILRAPLASIIAAWPIFERLARPNPENMESMPELATSWKYSKDVKSLTAYLRKGVKWHDGKEFTAEDVKFTFEKVMDPKTRTQFRIQISDLKSVEVIDKYTVKFNLKSPSSSFEAALQIPIIPKHLLEGKDINTDEFNHNPVGTGPFKFKEWVPGNHCIVEAYNKHWRRRPYLDRIVFKVIPDANVQMAQLKTGEIDIMHGVEPVQLKTLSKDPKLVPHRMIHACYHGLFWHSKKPPFNDIRVRKALNHAIDKKAIIDKVLLGEAILANSPFPPPFKWVYTDDVLKLEYNPEKAKKLLAEAGWKDTDGDGIVDKNGKPFTFPLIGGSASPTRRRITMICHQYLRAIGLDVKLQYKERSDFLKNWHWHPDKDWMTYNLNAFNPPIEPDALARRWHGKSGPRANQTRYNNPRVNELFAKGKATLDRNERAKIYKKIQRIITNDVPMVFVHYPIEIAVSNMRLKGVVPSPWRVYHNMEDWYIQ